APALPRTWFKPVCSGNQQVLNRVRTGEPPDRLATAASRVVEFSASPPSTISAPSVPVMATTLAPAPVSINRLSLSFVDAILPAAVWANARRDSARPPIAAFHVSQPNLSLQIQQLEEELGSQLFERVGRAVHLTAAGELFLEYAQRALHEVESGQQIIHDLKGLLLGTLRVGVTNSFSAE